MLYLVDLGTLNTGYWLLVALGLCLGLGLGVVPGLGLVDVLALITSLEVVEGVAVVVVAKDVAAVLALVAGYKFTEYSLTQSLQA